MDAARRIAPRAPSGAIDLAQGKIIVLSVGMSNTSQQFCNPTLADPLTCRGSEPFIPRVLADATVNHPQITFVNGARGNHAVDAWDSPSDPVYQWVRESVLSPQGLTPAQVQVVWLKQANRGSPTRPSLPHARSDAHVLLEALGNLVRTLRIHYPNLEQVYISNRTWGGYAANPMTNSPEPYAYETGFAVKWLIEAQIRQREGLSSDPLAGDLGPQAVPWIAWGPDLWADGMNPRADGLVWRRTDFHEDGIHPTPAGQGKVATMLLQHLRTVPMARCWLLIAGPPCASAPAAGGSSR
jgi:hypothetical protein